MLLDPDDPQYVALQQYDGILLRILHDLPENYPGPVQGPVGVWYITEEGQYRPLFPEPPSVTGEVSSRKLYRLEVSKSGKRLVRHRFLVRWCSTAGMASTYVPRISGAVYELAEHTHDGETTWELKTPAFTLYGVTL